MDLTLTKEEVSFLSNLLTKLNINPIQSDAEQVVFLAKSLVTKLVVAEELPK